MLLEDALRPRGGPYIYEWHMRGDGRKVPHFIRLTDRDVFGFAALWDRSRTEDGTAIESCTLITVPGNELMREVHNTGANPYRMPAILSKQDEEAWLRGDEAEARAALKSYASESMRSHEVSGKVNTPKNNDPSLLEPTTSASPQGSLDL